jgi:mono/diheme cytochrome c family protein
MRWLVLVLILSTSPLYAQDADLATRAVSLLEQRCFGCHGANLAQSGLRLNSREAILQGGSQSRF